MEEEFNGTITDSNQIECLLRMCDNHTMWDVLLNRMGEKWVNKEYKE